MRRDVVGCKQPIAAQSLPKSASLAAAEKDMMFLAIVFNQGESNPSVRL